MRTNSVCLPLPTAEQVRQWKPIFEVERRHPGYIEELRKMHRRVERRLNKR